VGLFVELNQLLATPTDAQLHVQLEQLQTLVLERHPISHVPYFTQPLHLDPGKGKESRTAERWVQEGRPKGKEAD
jgi:hypothetical protein